MNDHECMEFGAQDSKLHNKTETFISMCEQWVWIVEKGPEH